MTQHNPFTLPVSTGRLALSFAGMAILLSLSGCSENAVEAAKVLKRKSEDRIVAAAGEGEVAIQLLQKQYSELKEQLVRIKSLQRSFDRRASDMERRATELTGEGKADMASRQTAMAENYREKIDLLAEKEKDAAEELRQFALLYEDQKAEIRMLQEEIEVAKAIGGLGDDLAIDSPLRKRMESVNDLTEKLRQKLDRAESILDVQALEADF